MLCLPNLRRLQGYVWVDFFLTPKTFPQLRLDAHSEVGAPRRLAMPSALATAWGPRQGMVFRVLVLCRFRIFGVWDPSVAHEDLPLNPKP